MWGKEGGERDGGRGGEERWRETGGEGTGGEERWGETGGETGGEERWGEMGGEERWGVYQHDA